jgi:hypothetical protein
MSQTEEIKILVDSSLVDHFNEGLHQQHSNNLVEDQITRLVQIILDGSEYPISAEKTGKNEIRIRYHLRSFSEPIF